MLALEVDPNVEIKSSASEAGIAKWIHLLMCTFVCDNLFSELHGGMKRRSFYVYPRNQANLKKLGFDSNISFHVALSPFDIFFYLFSQPVEHSKLMLPLKAYLKLTCTKLELSINHSSEKLGRGSGPVAGRFVPHLLCVQTTDSISQTQGKPSTPRD